MLRVVLVSVISVLMFNGAVVVAQPQLEIVGVEAPDWNWGSQAINLKVKNASEHVRFVVIKTEFKSSGEDGTWQIQSRFSSWVQPKSVASLAPVISVPGNYGPATIRLSCYDVVDTLDIVLPGQEILDTTFSLAVEMPETARKWVNQLITMAPRVEVHPYFDDQFSRMFLQFVAAGIPITEMARISGCDETYVRSVLARFRRHGIALLGDTAIELSFPFITEAEARACLPLADKTAGLLADIVAGNLVGYEGYLDSLVKAGVIPDDRDNLINGTMLLYEPYVMVSAMLLWYDLGSRFVTDGKPLRIFDGTDICNAANVNFMYAVAGDESLTGHHFFALTPSKDGEGILFADHDPNLECSGNYPARPGVAVKATWSYPGSDRPEFFFLDAALADQPLITLGAGTDVVVQDVKKELAGVAGQYGRSQLGPGYRYWFWNMVATKTLDLLEERQVVKGKGTNNFQLGALARK